MPKEWLILILCLCIVHAEPLITGVMSESNLTVITGQGFGDGPDIILYDDFSGPYGSPISRDARIGTWDGTRGTYSSYDDEPAALLINETMRQLHVNFDPVIEIFISYRVVIPAGCSFPHATEPETFPSGSQWKLAWLMDGERGFMGNDDLVIPTWGNGVYFMIGGNDDAFQLPVGRPGTDTNWFSFKGWNRFSTYLKAGPIPDQNEGVVWAQGLSQEFGQKTFMAN
jgi:hypothetical protein